MENVSGLGGKRGKTILEELLERLNELGYSVHIRLLDAQEYGVPQRRRRYVIVGERCDMGNHYKYPKPTLERRTVREVIGMLPPPPDDGSDHPDIPLHRRDRLSEMNMRRLAALDEGQGRDDLPEELLANCHRVNSAIIGYRNVYGRMAWDDVAPTITAKFDSFTRGKFGHPDQMRSISLREGALLQTFPMDFIFVGNKMLYLREHEDIGGYINQWVDECIKFLSFVLIKRTFNRRAHRTHIILANTLSNCVFEGNADEATIEGRELNRANQLSTLM